MPDPNPPMKPQDTVIFLLGELKGQVAALGQSVDGHAAAQAIVNARHETEHADFRATDSRHESELAVLREQMPKRAPWWSVAAGVGAIVAVAGSAVTALAFILNK